MSNIEQWRGRGVEGTQEHFCINDIIKHSKWLKYSTFTCAPYFEYPVEQAFCEDEWRIYIDFLYLYHLLLDVTD
jgi:hypothetical protein